MSEGTKRKTSKLGSIFSGKSRSKKDLTTPTSSESDNGFGGIAAKDLESTSYHSDSTGSCRASSGSSKNDSNAMMAHPSKPSDKNESKYIDHHDIVVCDHMLAANSPDGKSSNQSMDHNSCPVCSSHGGAPFFTKQGLDGSYLGKEAGNSLAESVELLDGKMSLQKMVTQMHAAAVNGDKALLSKLLLTNSKDMDVGDQFGRTPLIFSILADRVGCAKLLLKAGCKIDKKDETGRTALHWAAHKGHYKCMKLLLKRGANWKEKDNEEETALHLCTRHKSMQCISILLKQLGAGEIDNQDKSKRTALHWAASYSNLDHMKLLIKQDSNSYIPDKDRKTPLHWAASSLEENAAACVRLILEASPSVINWQDSEGRTALHLAVEIGNDAVVGLLISYPSCTIQPDNMFRTPLHWAAALGHAKIAGMLLEVKPDCYASTDSNNATALHYAAQNNHAKTVEVFLTRASITDERDMEGRTALMWAASKAANDAITTYVRYHPDLKQTDKNGGTCLHAAALSGHASTVILLLEHGANVDAQDIMMHTPLFRACEMGHTDVVQALIDGGAQVEVIDQDGRSPLHWAALGGHAYICQMLIKYGVDPNVNDFSGRTPLQCAAYGGYVNCMSVLIENKANPNTQDKEGMSAVHWACSRGHLDAVKLLLEFHAFPNHMEATEDRYTPLDYALMGEHHEVAQYMIEQGALSITGIQEIAACKVQSAWRGFRVRKAFLERKALMVRHEQLRKDAARKRAGEEYKKKEDVRNKKELEDRYKQQNAATQAAAAQAAAEAAEAADVNKTHSRRKKKDELTEEERILREAKYKQVIVAAERNRLAYFRKRHNAALTIQKAWKMFKFKTKGILKNARDAIKLKRLDAGELEWKKQIAACTIQLAWRKYYRRKLLNALTQANNTVMHMWDPEIIAARQRTLVEAIYTEQLYAPHWHPTITAPLRPYWTRYLPSSAALSYNFAIDIYTQPRDIFLDMKPKTDYYDEYQLDYEGSRIRGRDSASPTHYSYNMNA